ncbi:MAG: hypothetical protein AB8B83_00345 [Bdellovibrionales bacterium]
MFMYTGRKTEDSAVTLEELNVLISSLRACADNMLSKPIAYGGIFAASSKPSRDAITSFDQRGMEQLERALDSIVSAIGDVQYFAEQSIADVRSGTRTIATGLSDTLTRNERRNGLTLLIARNISFHPDDVSTPFVQQTFASGYYGVVRDLLRFRNALDATENNHNYGVEFSALAEKYPMILDTFKDLNNAALSYVTDQFEDITGYSCRYRGFRDFDSTRLVNPQLG